MTKKEKKETYKRVQELTKELISCLVELEEDYLIMTPNDEKTYSSAVGFPKDKLPNMYMGAMEDKEEGGDVYAAVALTASNYYLSKASDEKVSFAMKQFYKTLKMRELFIKNIFKDIKDMNLN